MAPNNLVSLDLSVSQVVQSDAEEADRSERAGPRAQFCGYRCQDTGKMTLLLCLFCVCSGLLNVECCCVAQCLISHGLRALHKTLW